jgi:hypothetical protein
MFENVRFTAAHATRDLSFRLPQRRSEAAAEDEPRTQMPNVPVTVSLRRPALVVIVILVALLGSLLAAPASPAAAAAPPTIANPSFSTIGTDGRPTSWQVWNPAGTATLLVDQSGPGGTSAVSISSTSGSTARYALTQSLSVSDATPRKLSVSGLVSGTGLSGGFTMIRVQGYDASGKVVLPVARGPYLTGDVAWQPYTVDLDLPAGTTRLSVEPMLDRSGGTVRFSALEVRETVGTGKLTASATAAGTVELAWTQVSGAARYAVHRATGAQAPSADAASVARTAVAATTADDTVAPATTYTYQVSALEPDGSVLASSPTATVSTPTVFADRTRTSVLT